MKRYQPLNTKNTREASIKPEKTKASSVSVDLPQVQLLSIGEENEGQRLDNFLLTLLKGVPKSYIYRIIRSGEVRVNKGRAEAATRLACEDIVRVPPVRVSQSALSEPMVPAREFPVLYEDDYLLVVNKPAGVAVHGGSGVSYGLIEQLRKAMPEYLALELVHRLDRDTSGAIIVAKKRLALTGLQKQFRDREPGKTYLALVKGDWKEEGRKGSKVIDVPLYKYLTEQGERRVRVVSKDDPAGLRSVSIVRVEKRFKGFTLLSVTIKTGRTHQIRVHLSHLGYPIVGDDKYGDFELNKTFTKQYRFSRMFLHSYELNFKHPKTEESIEISAPLPVECLELMKKLEL
ncbi:MAG: RluA family pseudouridine synthase [Saezia sp.]